MSHFIPEPFRIHQPLDLNHYLVGGEIKTWNGPVIEVNSTISSTQEGDKTYLGSIPDIDEKAGMEALYSARAAYDLGKGLSTRNDLIEFIPELDYRLLEDELEADNSNTYGYLEEMY